MYIFGEHMKTVEFYFQSGYSEGLVNTHTGI